MERSGASICHRGPWPRSSDLGDPLQLIQARVPTEGFPLLSRNFLLGILISQSRLQGKGLATDVLEPRKGSGVEGCREEELSQSEMRRPSGRCQTWGQPSWFGSKPACRILISCRYWGVGGIGNEMLSWEMGMERGDGGRAEYPD